MEETEQHYTREQAAALLSMSVKFIDSQIRIGRQTAGRAGIFPVFKASRKLLRIPASSLNEYCRKNYR